MKKVCLIVFLVSACAFNTLPLYKEEISELAQDPKTRSINGNEKDVNDLNGCQIRYSLGQWQKDIRKGIWSGSWERESASINPKSIVSEGNVYLDVSAGKMNSSQVAKNLGFYPVYIGPWHYSPRLQKQIRFFAYYPKEGGNIRYQYESQTEENKNIPEKKFSLSPTAKYAPDRFGLCVVKWTAKYGYNAIAEVKSKNPFSKTYLVPTGKIIEAEE